FLCEYYFKACKNYFKNLFSTFKLHQIKSSISNSFHLEIIQNHFVKGNFLLPNIFIQSFIKCLCNQVQISEQYHHFSKEFILLIHYHSNIKSIAYAKQV
ncbi:CLUMA_CG004174, isoform A, partial [Clunio marinus]